ncbi:MAG: Mpo1-like protein [Acidobacteriota bacterium]
MRRIDALLADYGSSHRSRRNLTCHAIGMALIVFGLLSMLQTVRLRGPWTVSEALIGAAFLFYVWLDWPLALAVASAAGVLDIAARVSGRWQLGAAAFAIGWILQAIGHAVYEKNSPAFFRNLVHLMVGPAFLVNEALGIRKTPPAPASVNRTS